MDFKNPKQLSTYIKGLWVDGEGFLASKESDHSNAFSITLSEALNCFIGGRGTGKSSILHILDYLLSQRVPNLGTLEMICKYDELYLLYHLNGTDFLIGCYPPKKEYDEDSILKSFETQTFHNRNYEHKFKFDPEQIAKYSLKNYFLLAEISGKDGAIELKEVTSNKRSVMNRFFNERNAINELANITS